MPCMLSEKAPSVLLSGMLNCGLLRSSRSNFRLASLPACVQSAPKRLLRRFGATRATEGSSVDDAPASDEPPVREAAKLTEDAGVEARGVEETSPGRMSPSRSCRRVAGKIRRREK